MNFEDLKYVIAVADMGNFTLAANKVFVTQPSLSQRIRYVESLYGISLFVRTPKGAVLTDEGRCFVDYARRILSTEDDMRKSLSDISHSDQFILKVGVSQFMNSDFFTTIVNGVYEAWPELKYEIIEGSSSQLQKMLMNGDISIAFGYLPILYDGLEAQDVYCDQYVLVPAKGSAFEKKVKAAKRRNAGIIDPRMLDGEKFASGMLGTKTHDFLDKLSNQFGININVQYMCKNFSALYNIANSGIASVCINKSYFSTGERNLYYELNCEENHVDNSMMICVMYRKGAYLSEAAKIWIKQSRDYYDLCNIDENEI